MPSGRPPLPALSLVAPARRRIAEQVRALFADPGGRPSVVPAAPDQRLLPEGAVSFDVHADVVTMMIGGVASLMIQMLHPRALAGVWDHSRFREDPGGRLRRTAAFIATTTFGAADEARAAIARVRRIHERIGGHLPDGTPYRAQDPRLLAFVGVAEGWAFLEAYRRYRAPLMPLGDQDRYFGEMAAVARALGADPMPDDRRSVERFLIDVRSDLAVDERTRAALKFLTDMPPARPTLAPAQRLLVAAAVDLLPGWARRMHGLGAAGPAAPLLRAGAGGLGAMVRWALAAPREARA